MSESSSSTNTLMVRDECGHFRQATDDQVLVAAREAVDRKMKREVSFANPWAMKEYLRAKLCGYEHEIFAVVFLDNRNRMIEYAEMFRGTIDKASVHLREVVKEALRFNAAAVVFAHNHPSGHAMPSNDDRAVTKQLKEALLLVDVRALDHVIVAGNEVVSFAERGLM